MSERYKVDDGHDWKSIFDSQDNDNEWFFEEGDLQKLCSLLNEGERLRELLLSRHGGEPLALIRELDEARAENERLRELLDSAHTKNDSLFDERERLRAQVEALDKQRLDLVRALRLACEVGQRVAYRTANGIPQQMPPHVESMVRRVLREQREEE